MGKRKTLEEFEKEASIIHNGKYIYHQDYENAHKKIKITCPIHGDFEQTPSHHLKGQGCPKCGIFQGWNTRGRITTEIFKTRAHRIHGNKYNYNKSDYIGINTPICITCPIHGDFWQTPHAHLNGNGCPKCCKNYKLTTETFIEKANEVHKGKFIYNKSIYIKSNQKICITCPIHGEFWQTPNKHLLGYGCPKCNQSKLENEILIFLKKRNIVFNEQYTFDWLKNKRKLPLDFYLPDYNVAIECQGGQHFFPVEHFGGEKEFKKQIKRDEEKYKLLTENGIDIIYYTNVKNIPKKFADKHTYLTSLDDVIEVINKKSRQIDDEISEILTLE